MNRDYRYLKDEYLEEAEKSRKAGNSNTVYTFEMIRKLKEMARHDVYPDGRFGDDDCNVWSMLRN